MANDNPFAPPRATVRDVESGTQRYQEVSAFTYKGRIGRLRFLAYGVAAYILMAVGAGVLGALAGFLHFSPMIASGLVLIPYFIIIGMATIQRSHDMDWSGWMSLLGLIPLVGLIWIFKGGTQGENRFGAPPPPNTTGVKILALLLPVGAVVIGILAAIALPAYSDYTKRAKARQVQSAPPMQSAPAPAQAPVNP